MNLRVVFFTFVLVCLASVPLFAFAQNTTLFYVPCGNTVTASDGTQSVPNPCGFNHILILAKNLITGWIMAGVTIATLGFTYAGYLYITAAGNMEHVKHAHSIFLKVAVGFFFMLSAWLIVKALESAFLTDDQKARSFLGP